MKLHFAALFFLAVGLPAVAADKDEAADDSWMQEYYQHPQPEKFEAEVKKLQKLGALQNEAALPPEAAFFSRLFKGAKPEQLSQWLKFTATLPEADQQVFLMALRWADTQETQDALRAITTQKGKRAAYAKKVLGLEPPDFEKTKNPAPEDLDMCWGAFFATGSPTYALTVIRCATKPSKPNTIDMSQQAARWSLKALCGTHKKLREIKDSFYKDASPEERKALDELFKE